MKVVINPSYTQYEDFVKRIPQIFSLEGKTIYKARNEIKVYDVDGVQINVKRYKIPIWINRLIYRLFRHPKAMRAYDYAQFLLAKGIETPTPIAYILFTKWGLLSESYFISLQSSFQTLYKVGQSPVEDNADIFQALGVYMAKLHDAGIYHADFSPGNVLYERTDKGVNFSLVDINRMRFGFVSLKQGCANFARLWGREAAFHIMAWSYAKERHLDEEVCLRWILYYRNRFWKKYMLKHKMEFEL